MSVTCNIPTVLRRSCRFASLIKPDPDKQIPETKISAKRRTAEKQPSTSDVKTTVKRCKTELPDDISSLKDHAKPEAPNSVPLVPDGLLDVDDHELDLERTLMGGQSFRWTKQEPGVFTGVIRDSAYQLWRVNDRQVAFCRLTTANELDLKPAQLSCDIKRDLADYFQLRYNVKELYQKWSASDEHVAACCKQYKGFRILRQDPVENVFSFICATNNNIKRISQMIDKLCKTYGQPLPAACRKTNNNNDDESPSDGSGFYAFPQIERLAQSDVFECLRFKLGFGYRAKYIHSSAVKLLELSKESGLSPREYLLSLRQLDYKLSRTRLTLLPGIGRKVADCICLMSMDHLGAVPIDCHIYEIVCRQYMPKLRTSHKTLTEGVHDLIGDHFRGLHGSLAGWSTSVLFVAELKHLKAGAAGLSGQEEEKRKFAKTGAKRAAAKE